MIDRMADEVAHATRVLVAGCSGIMAAVVALEVLLRYVFGRSLFFSEELSRLTFVWAGFLATSLALRKGVHASVELAINLLPSGTRRALKVFAHAVVLFFLVLIFAAGVSILPGQWGQMTPTMEIRMFWFYLAVPVGVGLMIIQLLPILSRSLREERP